MANDSSLLVPGEPKEIPEELKEWLKEFAGGEEKSEVLTRMVEVVEYFSGLLPHPRILAQYKKIMPDAPERIMQMAEQQQAHRFYLEKTTVDGNEKRANLGLVLGFILFGIMAIGGIYLLAIGKELPGFGVFFTSIGAGIANYYRAVTERRRELATKNGEKAPSKKETSATQEKPK